MSAESELLIIRLIKNRIFRPFGIRNLFILGFLVLLFLTLYFLNSDWIITEIGWVDPWGYIGEALNPMTMRLALPHHPAGDLLPLIWPLSFFYKIFSPIYANFLYKLIQFVLTLFFFFRLAEILSSARVALISTILLSTYKYFLLGIGNDYTDGRVIFYLTICLFFAVYSFSNYNSFAEQEQKENLKHENLKLNINVDIYSQTKAITDSDVNESQILFQNANIFKRHTFLLLSGLFYSLCVSTAFLTLSLCLPLFLFIIFYSKKMTSQVYWKSFIWIIFGFCVGLGVLSLINYSYSGNFLYFSNTLHKAQAFLGQQRGLQSFDLKSCEWIFPSLFAALLFPILNFKSFFSIKDLKNLFNDHRFPIWLLNTSTLVIMLFLQYFKHQETISQYAYFNQLSPVVVLAFCIIMLYPCLNRLKLNEFIFTAIISIMFSLLVFFYTTTSYNRILLNLQSDYFRNFSLLSILFIYFFSFKNISLRKWSLLLFCFSTFVSINWHSLYVWTMAKNQNTSSYAKSREDVLNFTVRWSRYIDTIDSRREKYLWYNSSHDLLFLKGFSAASHLWQGRILNENFPLIDQPIGEFGVLPIESFEDKSLILIYSENDEFKIASQNFQKHNMTLVCTNLPIFSLYPDKFLFIKDCTAKKI